MIVVAETDPQLVGDRTFFHTADEQVDPQIAHELRQLDRVRVVDQHRAFVTQLAQQLDSPLDCRFASRPTRFDPQRAERANERKGFEGPAGIDGRSFAR